jgi:hypothetical protein
MGLLGSQIGGYAGAGLGEALGKVIDKRVGGGGIGQETGKNIGRALGTAAGAAIPYFKKGGAVKKTGAAYVHKGEYVLPAGVKPTKAQKAAVAKLHKTGHKM